MEKRGQVTIFVVVGLLILIILSVVFIIISTRNRVAESEITASTLDEVRRQVNLDVKLCFENIVEAGILDSSRHGGEAILWNQISTSNLNPCSMIPTATQEIRPMYGPELGNDCSIMIKDSPTRNPYPVNDLNEIDPTSSYFDFKRTLPAGFDSTSLEEYIRDKLSNCLKFNNYIDKDWTITADGNTWKYTNRDDIKNYLLRHSTVDDKAVDVTLVPTITNCPLDGKLVAKLNIPLKFSKENMIDEEESFVLDNQEFIYNADLTYFYTKVGELLDNGFMPKFNPDIPISQLGTSEICNNCGYLTNVINGIGSSVSACEATNGCHFYKATDPNTGAYIFNIKCGEYYFGPPLPDSKPINGKTVFLDGVSGDIANIKVNNGDITAIAKGTTVNVGGLDITYDRQRDSGEYVLLVGKGVSFLWGYYFGCGLPPNINKCFIDCPLQTSPSPNKPPLCT